MFATTKTRVAIDPDETTVIEIHGLDKRTRATVLHRLSVSETDGWFRSLVEILTPAKVKDAAGDPWALQLLAAALFMTQHSANSYSWGNSQLLPRLIQDMDRYLRAVVEEGVAMVPLVGEVRNALVGWKRMLDQNKKRAAAS
jgi:hypothetical protein